MNSGGNVILLSSAFHESLYLSHWFRGVLRSAWFLFHFHLCCDGGFCQLSIYFMSHNPNKNRKCMKFWTSAKTSLKHVSLPLLLYLNFNQEKIILLFFFIVVVVFSILLFSRTARMEKRVILLPLYVELGNWFDITIAHVYNQSNLKCVFLFLVIPVMKLFRPYIFISILIYI